MLRSAISPLNLVQAVSLAVVFSAALGCDPGQTPPNPGDICMVDGKIYRPGDSFPSADGCNSCSCTMGGQVACTLRACADAGAGGTCNYGGKQYPVGASFPSTDGCNTCFCGANGSVGCTKKACPDQPKACQRGGCSGEVCTDEAVATICVYQPQFACYKSATCERQADGKCGWTKTPALTACLASAKN